MKKYSFSGHESFYCKSLWLKKGYDFLTEGRSFLDDDAVVRLGVGKNMVTSIRYWLKAFGLTVNDQPTELAQIIFSNEGGDCFTEDVNTLWLLHYCLVHTQVASLYNLLFSDYQREKKEFEKNTLDAYIQRKCNVPEQKNVYNSNTVNKDMGVLLKNYFAPENFTAMEDFSALLIGLNLLRRVDKDTYAFNETSTSAIAPEIILYAILDSKNENDATMSFDAIQELALTFCMSVPAFTSIVRDLEKTHADLFHYTENSGIRNIQFLRDDFDKYQILTNYYAQR